MNISVSSYSFSRCMAEGSLTLRDTLQTARGMGIDAMEFTELPGASPDEQLSLARELRAEADRLGMTIRAYAVGANLFHDDPAASRAEAERLCRQVDVASVLGCAVMRHDACYTLGKRGNARSFDLMLPSMAGVARAVASYAEGKGIRTCVENHGYIAQDSDRMERLFNAVAHDNFGLLIDVGNFVCADEDCATAVSRLVPYAVHVHVKDMYLSDTPKEWYGRTRGGRFFQGAVIGEGDVPVERCLRILRNAGYDGYYTIEFEGGGDCLAGIRQGFANLRDMLSRV